MPRTIYDLRLTPPIANQTAITANGAETQMYAVATFAQIKSFLPQTASVFELYAGGILSTAAAATTLTITPRYGTTTGGVTLGASGAVTLPSSMTNVSWNLAAILTVRAAGNGANSTMVLNGTLVTQGAIATAGSAGVVAFGGTVATTANVTVDSGIFIGVTWGVAGCTMTPQQVFLRQVN